MKKKRIVLGLTMLFLGILLAGCQPKQPESSGGALFSWSTGIVADPGRLFQVMKEQKLNVLYQNFSRDLDEESIVSFLSNAEEQGTDVYFLTGDPQWALQPEGNTLCEEVDRMAEINRTLPGKKLKGILIDVEPYLLDEWENGSAQEVMDSFVAGMKTAYDRAKGYGLEVIVCMPYYFDSKGFERELETLIRSCCDKAAVMNYYRGKEIEHIETEAALAKKYNRELLSVYELKAPGTHGLTEKNTYFEEGLEAVEENFIQLTDAYPDQTISMALHDFEALEEVLGRE